MRSLGLPWTVTDGSGNTADVVAGDVWEIIETDDPTHIIVTLIPMEAAIVGKALAMQTVARMINKRFGGGEPGKGGRNPGSPPEPCPTESMSAVTLARQPR